MEYNTWQRMKQRTGNPRHPDFADYGGRGIVVCGRWLTSFENFFSDMGERPSPKHSIDRIDVDGPYSPENCRWATVLEQARNKRSVPTATIGGVTRTVAEWCRLNGINRSTARNRMRRGESAESAVTRRPHPGLRFQE